jgi:hypothetical protein
MDVGLATVLALQRAVTIRTGVGVLWVMLVGFGTADGTLPTLSLATTLGTIHFHRLLIHETRGADFLLHLTAIAINEQVSVVS